MTLGTQCFQARDASGNVWRRYDNFEGGIVDVGIDDEMETDQRRQKGTLPMTDTALAERAAQIVQRLGIGIAEATEKAFAELEAPVRHYALPVCDDDAATLAVAQRILAAGA